MSDACHICGGAQPEPIAGFAALTRVSSDCRPWPAGGGLGVCPACGAVQKRADAAWWADCAAIYRDYALYPLSGGAEQRVFDSAAGAMAARSQAILERLDHCLTLPARGRLLDIGCGNGGFLAAFAARHPGWTLHGAELDDRNRAALARIPGFETLHVGDAGAIGQRFDVVAMIHALEHIPAPVTFLANTVRDLLAPGGLLVLEVPDYTRNPFDLLILDHLVHFSVPVLARTLAAAGFTPLALTNQWVAKEITALAHPTPHSAPPCPTPDPAQVREAVTRSLDWLGHGIAAAQTLAAQAPLGLFGTAIAGT